MQPTAKTQPLLTYHHSEHYPTHVILSNLPAVGFPLRITKKDNEILLAYSMQTDALDKPTSWKALETDGEVSERLLPFVIAILKTYVITELTILQTQPSNEPWLHWLDSYRGRRVVISNTSLVCELAEEVQGIRQWRETEDVNVIYEILTAVVAGIIDRHISAAAELATQPEGAS
jgi:hypothetical protein